MKSKINPFNTYALIPVLALLVCSALLIMGMQGAPEGWTRTPSFGIVFYMTGLIVSILGFVYRSRVIIGCSALYIPGAMLINQASYNNLSLVGVVLAGGVFLLIVKALLDSFKYHLTLINN